MTTTDCPECRQGKHTICVEWSLDDADEVVPCPCSIRGHANPLATSAEPANEAPETLHVDPPNTVRVYRVYREEDESGVTFWCPICGRLDGAVLRGHGWEHIIEDASA